MKVTAAKHAKNAFGELIDEALIEPVIISKHGRPVVVVLAYQEFQRLARRKVAKGRAAKVNDPECADGGSTC